MDGVINLVPMMSNDFIEVMLCVVKSQIQRHVRMVYMNIHQLYHILMRYLPQQHDFADGGGRDAIAVLGLLEFLDGDGLAAVAGGFGSGEEDEAIGALADLPDQIVLLKPLRLVAAAAVVVAVGIRDTPGSAAISHGSLSLTVSPF